MDLDIESIQNEHKNQGSIHTGYAQHNTKGEITMIQSIGSFGWAIQRLQDGASVARRGWNGKDMYIKLINPHIDYETGISDCFKDIAKETDIKNIYESKLMVEVEPYIVMRTAQGSIQPGWLASQADILCDDWEEVS